MSIPSFEKVDLVRITAMTNQATRAYEIASGTTVAVAVSGMRRSSGKPCGMP
jgi:hypothetical protein